MAQRGKPFPTYVDESGEVVLSATDKFVMVEGGQTVHLEYSDLQAALNAQYAPLDDATIQLLNTTNTHRRGGRIAIVGDSISAGPLSGEQWVAEAYPNCRGQLWHDWWLYLINQAVRCDGNYAVGAQNMAHVRNVQMTNVLSMSPLPDAVVIAAGTNDSLATIETTWATLLDVISMAVNAGIRPALTTIPPKPADPGLATAWNARIRDFATLYDLPMVERNTPVNNAGDEEDWLDTYTSDNTHPNAAGSRAMGIAIAADTDLTAMFTPVLTALNDSSPTPRTNNLAGPFWNTFTGWDVSAFAGGERFWLDRNGHESVTFTQTASDKAAWFDVTADRDVVVAARLQINVGAFCQVKVTPLDVSNVAQGSAVILCQYLTNATPPATANRNGTIFARVKARPGTTKFRVQINSIGTVWLESITVVNAEPNG